MEGFKSEIPSAVTRAMSSIPRHRCRLAWPYVTPQSPPQFAPVTYPAADPLLGKIIDGRYEVLSVIGEGGMGTVYEVRHTTLGRRFALKVLRRDIADAEHTARFIQEAKAAAAIGHPNIVAVSDFGELVIPDGVARAAAPARAAGRRPCPTSSWSTSRASRSPSLLRAEKTLDPLRAADIVLQCASGLAAAHAAGVIHRDLKPDNVFLTRSGDREFVKLLDFGVAKMAGAGPAHPRGHGLRHAALHEPRAGRGAERRPPRRRLRARRHPLRVRSPAGCPSRPTPTWACSPSTCSRPPSPSSAWCPTPPASARSGPSPCAAWPRAPTIATRAWPSWSPPSSARCADAGVPAPAPPQRPAPRPRPRGAPTATSRSATPGLRPVVGPVGFGLGGLALALVVLLGVHELQSSRAEADPHTPGTAAPGASGSAGAVDRDEAHVVERARDQAGQGCGNGVAVAVGTDLSVTASSGRTASSSPRPALLEVQAVLEERLRGGPLRVHRPRHTTHRCSCGSWAPRRKRRAASARVAALAPAMTADRCSDRSHRWCWFQPGC